MNSKNWNDRADKDLFFTILSVKNIGVISGSEWVTIGNHMRSMNYGFTNEGCRQHFQGLRRAQNKADQNGTTPETSRKVDPTLNPITRRPGPGRGRPKKSIGGDSDSGAPTMPELQPAPMSGMGGPDQSQQDPNAQQSQQFQQAGHQQGQFQQQAQQPGQQAAQFLQQQTTQFHQQQASQGPQTFPSPPGPQPSQNQQSPDMSRATQDQEAQSNAGQGGSGEQSVGQHQNPVNQTSSAPEALPLESEDGEGEEDDGPNGPPMKRQRMEDDGMDEDQPLEDDPVLALADANDGAGEADAPYSEFGYDEA